MFFTIHYAIISIAALITALTFALLYTVRDSMGQAGVKTYTYINHRLRERKTGLLNYEKLSLFLKKHGAAYVLGRFAEPVRYLGLCVLLALVGASAGAGIHMAAAGVFAVLGAYLPKALLLFHNKEDNEKLLGDMKLMYRSLMLQASSGVYLTDALMECYQAVENRRLKDALIQVSNELAVTGDLEKALTGLQEGFDNRYIDTLCTILGQAAESGQSADLLHDISEQLKDVEQAQMHRQKERLERKTALLQLLFFTGILAAALYACAGEIWKRLAGF